MRYRYRTDEEMKDSGVEWIGKIPKDWIINKVKHVTYCEDGKRIPLSSEQRGKREGTIPYWGANSIIDYIDDYLIDYEVVLLGEDGAPFFDKSKDVAFYSNEKIWPNNHVHILKPKKRINAKFLVNSLNIVDFKNYIKGSTRDKLTQSDMKEIFIQLPSNIREQEKIANFLDEKTTQFDLIISKKEKLIERLEESKKSLISEVVTGKVKVVKNDDGYELVKRSSEEMKDSGVEWLGEIPNDWDYLPLKYLAKMSGGYAFSSDTFKDNGVQIIKIANLYNNKLSLGRQPNFVDTSYLESHKDFIVSKGDILISLTGTLGKRDYGYSIMLEDQQKFLLNQRVGKIKYNSNVNINYGIYILQSEPYLTSLYSLPTGTKQANLSNEHVLSIKVTLPDMDEQNKIVEYLDLKIGLINKNKYNILNQIEKLKEAKQSLISEAVTGKIEILD